MSRKAGTVSEDTQKNLIKAAISEFAEHGYQKSSLRRICAKAGVTTGALYFFFEDKGIQAEVSGKCGGDSGIVHVVFSGRFGFFYHDLGGAAEAGGAGCLFRG